MAAVGGDCSCRDEWRQAGVAREGRQSEASELGGVPLNAYPEHPDPPAWAGRPVALDDVEAELGRAWREGVAASASGQFGPLTVRASVLNLTAVATSVDEAASIARLLERLGAQHPSRTVIVVLPAESSGDTLAAWVKTTLLPLPVTGRQLIFEQITLTAGHRSARGIPAVVDRLLNSELPNFLWLLGEPRLRKSPCARMLAIADRLIVDSSCFVDLARTWRDLAEIVANESAAAVSDCAWNALGPWRELVAQFFDPPGLRPSLATIERISVAYEAPGRDGRSGLAKALLLLGWLCSRLGWRVTGVVPGGGASRTWQLASAGRTVAVSVEARQHDDGSADLRQITIVAGGANAGTFQVTRESPSSLSTTVEVAGTPSPVRVSRALTDDGMSCAVQGLNQFGRDRVFERAMLHAAELARGADRSAR